MNRSDLPSPLLTPVARGVRRHRWWLTGLVGLVAVVAILLWALAGAVTEPASSALARRADVARRPIAPAPTWPSYGWALAPPSQRVSVRLKAPLRSGLLFNVRTGQVLWRRNQNRLLPIASLTKMMTALLVVTHSSPSDRVLVTPQAVHFTGSGVGLLPLGKRVPELALLYGLLLPSGNDAAIALAEHVAGTQSRFVAMMNQEAQALGLRCTHFATVSGIVDHGNYSCAGDLALLAHKLLEQPLLARIVSTRSAVVPFPIKHHKLYLFNINPLLIIRYPGTDGVKTGFTSAAGQCFVVTARRGRTWLGAVLLHSANIELQGQTILNAGFAKFARRAGERRGT